MKSRFLLLALAGAVALRAADNVMLSSVVKVRDADNEHARPALDTNAKNGPLRLAGRDFTRGVGTQTDTRVAVALGGATRFTAVAGVDDESPTDAAVVFEALAGGQSLWRRELKKGDAPVALDLDLRGRQTLVLVTADQGNTESEALADWADAAFSGGRRRTQVRAARAVRQPRVIHWLARHPRRRASMGRGCSDRGRDIPSSFRFPPRESGRWHMWSRDCRPAWPSTPRPVKSLA